MFFSWSFFSRAFCRGFLYLLGVFGVFGGFYRSNPPRDNASILVGFETSVVGLGPSVLEGL